MAVCCGDERKIYTPPEGNQRPIDLEVKAYIEEELGLKMEGWTVLWYRVGDPDMVTEFVTLETA